ncbi:hypothetical protein ACRAWF_34150 [Streptomyces sp. L7]
MDVERYLRNVQDRVANGVRERACRSRLSDGRVRPARSRTSANNTVHADKVEGSTFVVGDHGSASSTHTTANQASTASEGTRPRWQRMSRTSTLGNVSHSTFAVGRNAQAVSHHGTAPQRDQAAEELLTAVARTGAADLARVRGNRSDGGTGRRHPPTRRTRSPRTGQAAPTRRERLRELLADSQALLTVLASAGAVAGLVGL